MYFDRSKILLKPLSERVHDLNSDSILPLSKVSVDNQSIKEAGERIRLAKENGRAVIQMMGGHVIRSGIQKYLIDMLEKRQISCLAANGSVAIHDYEMSLIGATTESVAKYISEGQFGLWEETSKLNDIVNIAYKKGGIGMGEAIGKAIYESDHPFKELSIFSACYRLKVPITVHVGIGYDILHEHPNFNGAAAGATSYLDFLRFAKVMESLEGGVIMNFGSGVMAPEVFLKALSMVRNVARQSGEKIEKFTSLVCDLADLPGDFAAEPPKESAGYYFRPWKTMLVRTVKDGGESFYVKGRHSKTIPMLWSALNA